MHLGLPSAQPRFPGAYLTYGCAPRVAVSVIPLVLLVQLVAALIFDACDVNHITCLTHAIEIAARQ